jgi:hypothetical protein
MSDDVDGLCATLDGVKNEIDKLRRFEYELRNILYAMSAGETKTRRVVGTDWEAVVVEPDSYWEQPTLKELWNDYSAEVVNKYLRVASIAPNLKEVKKLKNTVTDNEELQEFKTKLLAAERPANSPPRVTVTKVEHDERTRKESS